MLKKILSLILIMSLVLSLSACGAVTDYSYGPVSGGANAGDAVSNNGSYVVEKGDYIYYINSSKMTNLEYTFGETTEGVIMRASKDGSNQEVVFPKLVSNTSGSGLYIIGDRIYFTSPSDATDSKGNLQSKYLDVMSVKLDGTDAQKHVTLASTSYKVAFMQGASTVYAVWEDGTNKISRLDLSNSKAKAEVIAEKFTAMQFVDDMIVFSTSVIAGREETVAQTYSNIYTMTVEGEPQLIVSGEGTYDSIATLVRIDGGKIYYTLSDSVVTASNSLYVCDLDGSNAKRISTKSYGANGVLAYADGYLLSGAEGTYYYGSDNTITKVIGSSLEMQFVYGDYVYYTVAEKDTSYSTLGRVNIAKAFAGEEVEKEQVLFISEDGGEDDEALYDTLYLYNYAKLAVVGDELYYYSFVQNGEDRVLYSWNLNNQAFTKVGIDK